MLILRTLLPTLVMWVALVVIAFVLDGTWPDSNDAWFTFLLICLLIEVGLVKSMLMWRGMRGWDSLTGSLIAFNLVLAALFLIQELFYLWPEFWYAEHGDVTRWMVRGLEGMLVVAAVWTIAELAQTPESRDASLSD